MDEGSTTSAEVFGIIESNVTRSTRATGTWKLRAASTGEERPFGGCNLLFFVDWWQLPPVKSTDLKSTPYPEKAASPMVQKAMTFFWNRSVDSFTGMTELTHSYRQALDPWFSEFLRQCRHGQLSWTMYCFFHGLPTIAWVAFSCVQMLSKWPAKLAIANHGCGHVAGAFRLNPKIAFMFKSKRWVVKSKSVR